MGLPVGFLDFLGRPVEGAEVLVEFWFVESLRLAAASRQLPFLPLAEVVRGWARYHRVGREGDGGGESGVGRHDDEGSARRLRGNTAVKILKRVLVQRLVTRRCRKIKVVRRNCLIFRL
jgi:hypothetical protein